jgi:hypothetical protein
MLGLALFALCPRETAECGPLIAFPAAPDSTLRSPAAATSEASRAETMASASERMWGTPSFDTISARHFRVDGTAPAIV